MLISAFRSHHFKPRDYVPFALLGLLSSVEFGCMYTGIQYLSAGLSAILYNTCPIWVALFAWPLLGETMNLKKAIGFGIGFLGVVFIFATGLTIDPVGIEVLSGAVLLILAALGYALVTIGFKKYLKIVIYCLETVFCSLRHLLFCSLFRFQKISRSARI